MLPFFLHEKQIRYAIIMYVLLLLSANFVGDRALQIFHFSYSLGTLVIQLAFCWILAIAETIGFRRSARLVCISALLNIIVALVSNFGLQFPLPEFWLSPDIDNTDEWDRFNVICSLTVGYVCSALVMIYVAAITRVMLGSKSLLLRVVLSLFAGIAVDIIILFPILYFICVDRYIGLWKILSLASVKVSLSLVAIPISYCLIHVLKKRILIVNTKLSRA